jgi:peroxiredoxin
MSGYSFPVTPLPPADPPAVGEPAPEFRLPLVTDEYWRDVSLSELVAERPTLLVFSSMDGTGYATYTWIELRERGIGGENLGVAGVSVSTPYEHHAFIREHDLPYPLFSDPGNVAGERYGLARGHDGMANLEEPHPALVLVDGEQVVRYAWVAEEWPEFPDWDRLEQELAAALSDLE